MGAFSPPPKETPNGYFKKLNGENGLIEDGRQKLHCDVIGMFER
jgi:hypothetical protein